MKRGACAARDVLAARAARRCEHSRWLASEFAATVIHDVTAEWPANHPELRNATPEWGTADGKCSLLGGVSIH